MVVPALTDWPTPRSQMLASLIASIRSRSKAFNKSTKQFHIDLKTETVANVTYERLNLRLENWNPRPIRLSFAFWDDGVLLVDSRQVSESGWEYEFSFYGDINDVVSDNVRDMIEDSMWITKHDIMQSVWRGCKPYTE